MQILHNNNDKILYCGETASECLPYASITPNIVKILAFLNSREELLKCIASADFQMSPPDIG
jgi:hypothetical protein